jgi:hypothetical protein
MRGVFSARAASAKAVKMDASILRDVLPQVGLGLAKHSGTPDQQSKRYFP